MVAHLPLGILAGLLAASCGSVETDPDGDADSDADSDDDCAAGAECEPNGSCDGANGPYVDLLSVLGSFDSETDVDFFSMELSRMARLVVSTTSDGDCGASDGGGSSDTFVVLYDAACVQIAFNDDNGESWCSWISQEGTPPGMYHVEVRTVQLGSDPGYLLTAQGF